MRCHYEVLELDMTCDEDDIKRQYKSLALKYHPDRNRGNEEGVEEIMKEVNSAYSVLKDPNQRRHYDANRDAILRGDDDFSSSNMSDDHPSPTFVYKYFYSSCYHGYGDDPNGFFAVYRNLFEHLSTLEKQAAEVDPTGQYATGGRRKMAKFKEGPSFGSLASSHDDVFAFYEYWKSFESRLSFDWIGPSDMDMMMSMMGGFELDPFYFSAAARREYTRSVTDLIDYLDRCDPRLSAAREEYKENRKAAKRNARLKKYGSDADQSEDSALVLEQLRTKALEWSRTLLPQGEGVGEVMSKSDKEKLRKAQSKVRNVFKKLLRLTSSDSGTEYGKFTVDEVESICANCAVDDINLANGVLGGEAATKDSSLFRLVAVDEVVRSLMESSTARARSIEEDISMSRYVRQKRTQQQVVPVPPSYQWTIEERGFLVAALDRYPPGSNPFLHIAQLESPPSSSVSRWLMIANYVNYQRLQLQEGQSRGGCAIELSSLFSEDDVLIEAFKVCNLTSDS